MIKRYDAHEITSDKAILQNLLEAEHKKVAEKDKEIERLKKQLEHCWCWDEKL